MQPMSVGIMLGVGDDPDTSLEKVKTIGVDNVQLGCPPDQYFSPDAQEKLKQSISASGITITTVFCGFAGESYADIPTVKRTVGYVPRRFPHRTHRQNQANLRFRQESWRGPNCSPRRFSSLRIIPTRSTRRW